MEDNKRREKADRGEDVTPYMDLPKKGHAARMKERDIQRTNIDFGLEMVAKLDSIATKLNIF